MRAINGIPEKTNRYILYREEESGIEAIRRIYVYLECGWVVCGVKLILQKGEMILAEQANEIASVDITYDGINLMADTWWAFSFGMALSKYLGCPRKTRWS